MITCRCAAVVKIRRERSCMTCGRLRLSRRVRSASRCVVEDVECLLCGAMRTARGSRCVAHRARASCCIGSSGHAASQDILDVQKHLPMHICYSYPCFFQDTKASV